MLAIVLGLFTILLGLLLTILGLLFLLKPDSDWVRLIRRTPEDVIHDDVDLMGFRVIGLIVLIAGLVIAVRTILKIFVW